MFPQISKQQQSSSSNPITASTLFSHLLGKRGAEEESKVKIGEKENEELKRLLFGSSEKIQLLSLFQELCNGKYTASFDSFVSYFQFTTAAIYVRRMFDIMNIKVNGSVTLFEFIHFCGKYLLVDQNYSEEFSFRLLSRRGSNFMPQFSVLDLDDMLTFVALKYSNDAKSLPKQKKLALLIFGSVCDDDDGITFSKFQEFCRRNPVFLRVTHPIQNHLRKCIFGIEFWVERSRRLKATLGVSLFLSSNRISEQYTLNHIQDPVVDEHGYPIKTLSKKRGRMKFNKEQDKTLDENASPRFCLSFTEAFAFEHFLSKFGLDIDFPDVIKQRELKKLQKLQAKTQKHSTLRALSVRTYDLLIQACADLIYHRRDTRKAFNKWLASVDMTRGDKVGDIEQSAESGACLSSQSFDVHERIVTNNQMIYENREMCIVESYADQQFQGLTLRSKDLNEWNRLTEIRRAIRIAKFD